MKEAKKIILSIFPLIINSKFMLKLFLFHILLLFSVNTYAVSKIYLIRHARVKIENPGWSTAKTAHDYRTQYNVNPVEAFDAKTVLNKIQDYESIDTVFCSPQSRALQTAVMLFNTQAKLCINENLMEFDYPVIHFPLIKLPVRVWHGISIILWRTGINARGSLPYTYRKQMLEDYSKELISYAEKNGTLVIVAHGVLNRELMKILKKKGWKSEQKDGYENLSVNCMVK